MDGNKCARRRELFKYTWSTGCTIRNTITMSSQLIPLIAAPNQTFSAQLTVNGYPLTLNFNLSFSNMAGYWQLAVSDVNGNLLIASVPLVTGLYPAANMLAQYQYMNIGSAYLLNTGNAPTDYPGPDDLSQFSLLWGDNS
jgi:hypothetical protein